MNDFTTPYRLSPGRQGVLLQACSLERQNRFCFLRQNKERIRDINISFTDMSNDEMADALMEIEGLPVPMDVEEPGQAGDGDVQKKPSHPA